MDLTTATGRAAEAHAKFLDKQATGQAVIAAVTEKVSGQGAAYADTAAGGMEQFHAQLNHLEETMGSGLLPAITAVAEKLSNLGSYLSQHTTLAKALVVGLGALSVTLLAVSAATSIVSAAMGIAKVATATWTVAQWALNVALDANPIGVVIIAIAALTAAIIVAYQHSEKFRQIVGEALDFVKDRALALSFVFGGELVAGVVRVYQHFGTLRSIAVGAMNAIGDAVAAMVALAIGAWNRMRAVGSAVFGAIEGFAHATAAAFNALVGAIDAVLGALREVIHVANEALGAIHAVTSAPGRAAGAVMGVIPHAAGGAVAAGASYLVGERGPELFVSGASGAIVPNSELGASGWAAGGTTNYTFNFPHYLGREQDLANAVRGALAKHKFRGGR